MRDSVRQSKPSKGALGSRFSGDDKRLLRRPRVAGSSPAGGATKKARKQCVYGLFSLYSFDPVLCNLAQTHTVILYSVFMSESEAFFLLGSNTWAYWFMVKLAVACPANSDTVLGFSPA